jgi:hypothetical protein
MEWICVYVCNGSFFDGFKLADFNTIDLVCHFCENVNYREQCNYRWWYFREQQHSYETNLKSVKIMFYFVTALLYYFLHLTGCSKILSSFCSISQPVWSDHTHKFYLPSSSRFTHVLQPKICWNPRIYMYVGWLKSFKTAPISLSRY